MFLLLNYNYYHTLNSLIFAVVAAAVFFWLYNICLKSTTISTHMYQRAYKCVDLCFLMKKSAKIRLMEYFCSPKGIILSPEDRWKYLYCGKVIHSSGIVIAKQIQCTLIWAYKNSISQESSFGRIGLDGWFMDTLELKGTTGVWQCIFPSP